MPEHRGAGTGGDYFAVLFQHHTQAFKVNALHATHLSAGDEACRRGVVGNDALEIEAEVLVARVDHFNCRQNKIGSRQYVANMHARSLERMLEDKGDLGLDLGMDQAVNIDSRAVQARAVVRKEAVDRVSDPHLLHFRERGQAHFQASDTYTAGLLALANGVLDGVGVFPVHVGVRVGNLGHRLSVELGIFQVFGQLGDSCCREIHKDFLQTKRTEAEPMPPRLMRN
ncbi:hypothetical protein D3C75_750100 [compost metagenome]